MIVRDDGLPIVLEEVDNISCLDSYNVRVVKLPQKCSIELLEKVLEYIYVNRRTVAFSTADSIQLMRNKLANNKSLIEVVSPEEPSQQEAIREYDALGISWTGMSVYRSVI